MGTLIEVFLKRKCSDNETTSEEKRIGEPSHQ